MKGRQKKKLVSLITSLLLFLIASLVANKVSPQSKPAATANVPAGYYRVTEFVDGDTIAVDMDGRTEKVRFIGVDTPETHKPNSPVQCFGEAAAAFTKATIGSSGVRLEADPTNSNRDVYDRLLRYVYVPDGRLINLEIIKQGYGFAYVSFPFTKLDEFRAAQVEAREASRGLWSSCEIKTISGERSQTNDVP